MSDARAGRAETIRAAVAAGVDWVQVRDRTLDGRALLAFVLRVAEAAAAGAAERSGAATVIVNRRVDVAIAAAAAGAPVPLGVHLGFDALPLPEARRLLAALGAGAGPVGLATHTPDEVAAAAAAGADYVQLAPIFDPLSKPRERPALGIERLAEASGRRGAGPRPRLLAQGGIDADGAARALRAGADGVAVTGAILGAACPGDAAARLRATLDRVVPGPG